MQALQNTAYKGTATMQTLHCSVLQAFSGFGTNAQEMAQALRQDLIVDNLPFEDGIFSYAVYDPPTTLWNRHNEIWVRKPDS